MFGMYNGSCLYINTCLLITSVSARTSNFEQACRNMVPFVTNFWDAIRTYGTSLSYAGGCSNEMLGLSSDTIKFMKSSLSQTTVINQLLKETNASATAISSCYVNSEVICSHAIDSEYEPYDDCEATKSTVLRRISACENQKCPDIITGGIRLIDSFCTSARDELEQDLLDCEAIVENYNVCQSILVSSFLLEPSACHGDNWSGYCKNKPIKMSGADSSSCANALLPALLLTEDITLQKLRRGIQASMSPSAVDEYCNYLRVYASLFYVRRRADIIVKRESLAATNQSCHNLTTYLKSRFIDPLTERDKNMEDKLMKLESYVQSILDLGIEEQKYIQNYVEEQKSQFRYLPKSPITSYSKEIQLQPSDYVTFAHVRDHVHSLYTAMAESTELPLYGNLISITAEKKKPVAVTTDSKGRTTLNSMFLNMENCASNGSLLQSLADISIVQPVAFDSVKGYFANLWQFYFFKISTVLRQVDSSEIAGTLSELRELRQDQALCIDSIYSGIQTWLDYHCSNQSSNSMLQFHDMLISLIAIQQNHYA